MCTVLFMGCFNTQPPQLVLLYTLKCKNIKMLKDSGMAVSKTRETRAARRKIMAYNNNTMHNSHILKRYREGLCMVLLLYVIIFCLVGYILS